MRPAGEGDRGLGQPVDGHGDCADIATASRPVPAAPTLDVPALGINSEYFFNPTSTSTPPDPQAKAAGVPRSWPGAGTDAMLIGLRSSTHLEYTYVPYILPASRIGERVAFHYTLAWLDRYVKGDPAAFDRLTATTFDASADASSIGAGTYDPARPPPTRPTRRRATCPTRSRDCRWPTACRSTTPPSTR